jgi:CheY-like chemotaxis protein
MNAYDVLVLGPHGPSRADLEQTLRRLGHAVVAAELERGPELAAGERYDVVVVDVRADEVDPRALADAGGPEWSALLLVADQPRKLADLLRGRAPGGLMVLTGAESDGGYQVALSVCAALRRARAAQEVGPALA